MCKTSLGFKAVTTVSLHLFHVGLQHGFVRKSFSLALLLSSMFNYGGFHQTLIAKATYPSLRVFTRIRS